MEMQRVNRVLFVMVIVAGVIALSLNIVGGEWRNVVIDVFILSMVIGAKVMNRRNV